MSAAQINRDILAYNTANHDWCLNGGQKGAGKPLKEMTVSELRRIAKRMSIKGRSVLKKDELIKAIRRIASSMKKRPIHTK